MKILYVATIASTMVFFPALIKKLIDEGHTVDIACSQSEELKECYREWGCKVYPTSCSRSPFKTGNFRAIRQIRKIVSDNHYDIVHCHTPIAAFCTRLACRPLRKNGVTVMYTVHGLHFYKGAPLKNWLIYYPAEKLCAHFTDVLITINREDYERAKKTLKAKKVEYVPGVGIDLEKFNSSDGDRAITRGELGIPQSATLLLSVGELNKNKNHETVIKAIADMDVYYMIAGTGDKRSTLEALANKLGLSKRVKFLGYRTDISRLYRAADAFAFPSFREGLPVSLMEAMATGLPGAVSRIRGNVDLIDEKGGVLFDPDNIDNCRAALCLLLQSDLRVLGSYNRKKVHNFSSELVLQQMMALYNT